MKQGNKKHGCLTQLLISLGLIAVLIVGLLIIRAVKRSSRSKVPAGGINESLYVDINGTKQWINIYGQNRENPVLLYLHGGPGSAVSPYSRISASQNTPAVAVPSASAAATSLLDASCAVGRLCSSE